MWTNAQETFDLFTFTEEIFSGKFHYLCSVFLLESSSDRTPKPVKSTKSYMTPFLWFLIIVVVNSLTQSCNFVFSYTWTHGQVSLIILFVSGIMISFMYETFDQQYKNHKSKSMGFNQYTRLASNLTCLLQLRSFLGSKNVTVLKCLQNIWD